MSNFNERHPPMGSEKDIDNQATSNRSGRGQYTAYASSSEEELDELSLRVRALLAESDDEIIEFSSRKESSMHQKGPQSSETEFDSQAAKNFDSTSSTSTQSFYSSYEGEEKLSVDKKCDSGYSTAMLSPQQSGDKDDKECPSQSRYSDHDTTSLPVSNITSSKRLEWDNAADIGYAKDTVDEKNSQKKSRREPEGFSLASHKFSYSTSSKYSKTAPQQMSAKCTTIIYERDQPFHVSQSLDIHDRSLASEGSISSIKKDFSKEDKSVSEKTQYSSAKSSMVTESISDTHKEPKLQIHPDLSVRPKDRAYTKKDRNYERKSVLTKDQSFVSERGTEYLKKKESEISKSDFSKSQNKDSEASKKRVSFVPSETFEGNVNIINSIKPEGDATSARNFEPQPYQPISDLSEEYRRSIFMYGSRYFIPSPISSSDDLPHIRWYPIHPSQDTRNASTQTSLRQSNEAGTSSEIPDELHQIFVESSDVVKNLHMTKTIDRNSVNLYSLPPGWQSSEGVNSTAQFTSKYIDDSDMGLCSSKSAKADIPSEFLTPQDRNELSHVEEMDFESVGVGTVKVHDCGRSSIFSRDSIDDADSTESFITAQEFRDIPTDVGAKDASIQVNNCSCLEDFKKIFKKALRTVPAEKMCPLHKYLMVKLDRDPETRRISLDSEVYDIVFVDDNTPEVLDAENSPLYFCSIFTRPVRCVSSKSPRRKLFKRGRQRALELRTKDEIEDREKFFRKEYRKIAKEFSRELAKRARKGKIEFAWNEHILKKSSWLSIIAKKTKYCHF